MKIIDVSIFCNIYEKELALLKLNHEDHCIDQFVWCENTYDYRGKYKGPLLKDMINGDSRFDKFKNKIVTVTLDHDFTNGKGTDLQRNIDPEEFDMAEKELRNSPAQYISDAFYGNDRLLITDIDELWDTTNQKRIDKVFETLKKYPHDPIQFERVRYSFDYDIRSWRSHGDIICPCYAVDHIIYGHASLCDKKWIGHLIPNGDNIAFFEYCFCFPIEGIYQKFNSSLHTCWSKEKIDQSIRTAIWTDTDYQKVDFNNRWRWFERVKLTEKNSPQYIRENFDKISTKLVPENYRENRIKEFGRNPYFPENIDDN